MCVSSSTPGGSTSRTSDNVDWSSTPPSGTWVGGPPDSSGGFYLTEAFQKPDQRRKDIIQQKSLGTDML